MMEDAFIKIYVLVSLWLWAGMLLSAPLRKAFADMHHRIPKQVNDAVWKRVVKTFKGTTVYVENRTYTLRVKVARSLVSRESLDELARKNFIAAISRARKMDQGNPGFCYEEFEKLVNLAAGRSINEEEKEAAVKTAFVLSNTTFLQDIITKMPYAQERILLAFEQAEGNAPYDSVKNEEFRKFIRE